MTDLVDEPRGLLQELEDIEFCVEDGGLHTSARRLRALRPLLEAREQALLARVAELEEYLHRIAQSDYAWESGTVAEVLNELGYEWIERGADRKTAGNTSKPLERWNWLASLVMDWIRANDESMLAYIEQGKPSKEILQRRMETSQALRKVYDAPWVKVAAERYKNEVRATLEGRTQE